MFEGFKIEHLGGRRTLLSRVIGWKLRRHTREFLQAFRVITAEVRDS